MNWLTNISRTFYDELGFINDEWKGCTINWKTKELVIPIGKIWLSGLEDDEDESVFIGSFEIRLSFAPFLAEKTEMIDAIDSDVLCARQVGTSRIVDNKKPTTNTVRGNPHPHVDSGGKVCFGGMLTPVLKMLNSCCLHDVVRTTKEVLESYNSADAYEPLEGWKAFEEYEICSACDDNYTEGLGCDHRICDSCTTYCDNRNCSNSCPDCHSFDNCEGCGRHFCSEHMDGCSGCSNCVCSSCNFVCSECGETFCSSCRRENDCPYCDASICKDCTHDCDQSPEDEDDEDDEESETEDAAGETAEAEETGSDVLAHSVPESEVCLSPPE
jgi:hypothetical protein